jgi:hypothetical protein
LSKHKINLPQPASKKPQFAAFTIKHNGTARRIVTDIGVSEPFDPNEYVDKKAPHEPFQSKALWDTGATDSVITPATAKKLGIDPVGTAEVVHYGGKKQSNTYLVNLYLPNKVLMYGIRVTESDEVLDDFGVILGMDIICRGDFSITNEGGLTWMSFRFPSIKGIDYVIDANRISFAGVNRYAPCPCGKVGEDGKRVQFRFCHGVGLERRG